MHSLLKKKKHPCSSHARLSTLPLFSHLAASAGRAPVPVPVPSRTSPSPSPSPSSPSLPLPRRGGAPAEPRHGRLNVLRAACGDARAAASCHGAARESPAAGYVARLPPGAACSWRSWRSPLVDLECLPSSAKHIVLVLRFVVRK